MDREDIGCEEFSNLLEKKKDHYPYSDAYIDTVHDSPDKSGNTEREHMVIWFRSNETLGVAGYRRAKPNKSAKHCYNHLMNAASLLWIAEAVGIDEHLVKKAYDAAAAESDYRRACGAIRRIISWDMICEKAL